MRKLVLTCLAAGVFMTSVQAQTLFTYGDTPVSKEEFLRVYEKNSLNKKPDFSDTALRGYLDLYSLFRMKVTEAESQHLDTLTSIQRELDNYRKQLARNYLTDEQVTKRLIHEAYERSKEDVHIAHILILCRPGTDSVAAYHKIDSIYNVLENKKADFATMAKEYSEDRGSKESGGDIGYITALEVTYPIENVAYSTPVGKFSKPFRTQFGYHIVKVLDKRPAVGEIKVAQILIECPKSKGEEGVEAARKRADSVEMEIKKGVPFNELVKKYSDDKFTINDNGVMPQFGVGKMVPSFESAAFALKNPGDVSKPVQTEYGFHIIKLLDKYPLKPFDTLEPQLKRKVENDYRSQVARDIFFEKIKEKNGFKEYPANYQEIITKLNNAPDTANGSKTFRVSDFMDMNKPVFTLAGRDYKQSDFMSFAESVTRGRLMGPKETVLHDLYTMYVTNVVNDFEEHKLVEENPDFKNLMEEYRDGVMLFELMDRNVWGKASRDTVGLEAFYEAHKNKYMWEPGFVGSEYKFKDEASLKEGLKLLSKRNVTDSALVKIMNSDAKPDAVIIQHGHYEFSRFKDVPRSSIVKDKATEAVKNSNGTYTVVKAQEVYNEPTPKSLDEARGYVVAEYQDYLEKNWNKQMRDKYPMKVDQTVFESMVKK